MSRMLPLAAPTFDEAEVEAVAEVVRSAWLTMGPRTAAFEEAFAELTGTRVTTVQSHVERGLRRLRATVAGTGDETA